VREGLLHKRANLDSPDYQVILFDHYLVVAKVKWIHAEKHYLVVRRVRDEKKGEGIGVLT
jgi:hypothetical protein